MSSKAMGSRRITRAVQAGSLGIGGGNTISVQTMWKRPVDENSSRLLDEVEHLRILGCDIIRFAVPDLRSAEFLGNLASRCTLPLVADIHFDYRIALECLNYPFAKIRINPGNIGAHWKVREVAHKAKDCGTPIRVGVNAGSLPAEVSGGGTRAEAMVRAAESEVEILESMAFEDIVVSLKSSDIETTVEANKLFAERSGYPLHLGVTEAGPLIGGIVKNSIGISRLLRDGIGDTVRVSLSASPLDEIIAGRDILIAENMYERGIRIISCPTCGRATFDVQQFILDNREYLYSLSQQATVAIMGCPVNGPGEAREADIGITGSGNTVLLFKEGKEIARLSPEEGAKLFREMLESL